MIVSAVTASQLRFLWSASPWSVNSDTLPRDVYSVSQKNPPRGFLAFFANGYEFLVQILTPIIRSYLRYTTNFYSII